MIEVEGPDWDFKFGIIFDTEYTQKILRICNLYDVNPHEMLRLAIDTMTKEMDEQDG